MKKKFFIVIISTVIFCGCTQQKVVKRQGLRMKSEKIFTELDTEEASRGIIKSDEQIQTEKNLSKFVKEEAKEIKPETSEFEEIGEGYASKYERAIDAEKRAEEEAIRKAMRKAGVDVFYGFQDVLAQYDKTPYQFVSRYLYNWSSAVVEYEKIGNSVFETLTNGETKCTVKLKGKIYMKGSPDPGYEIRLDLKGEQLGLNQPVYYAGDEVKVSFWSTKDSYVHLLSVDENQNVSLIYPNKYIEPKIIKSGEIFKFPPSHSGITLKAVLPANRKETLELLHVILTKTEPIFTLAETKETQLGDYKQLSLGNLLSVSKRLAKLDRSEWTMLVLPYVIKSRGGMK